MATKEAIRRAVKKYQASKVSIRVWAEPQEKDKYQNHAVARGESLNAFALRAMEEALLRDTNVAPKP